MAFLEVLTRTFGERPGLLARCQASLEQLEDGDWTQRILVDKERRGVARACRRLARVEATGEWVWVLDDDDLCRYRGLVGMLRSQPDEIDAVMVRVQHGTFGLLPPRDRWGQEPVCGQIGPSNVIVRRETWQRYREGWTDAYTGDFAYIHGLWEAGVRFAWVDVLAAEQPEAMQGAGERAS
jgi:hypothetical protein